MIVDCTTCPVRGQRCDDCAITALRAHGSADYPSSWDLGLTAELQLDAAEKRVVSMFVDAGLLKPAAAATLWARRESVPRHQAVRDVG